MLFVLVCIIYCYNSRYGYFYTVLYGADLKILVVQNSEGVGYICTDRHGSEQKKAGGRQDARVHLSDLTTSEVGPGRWTVVFRALMEATDLHQNVRKVWLHLHGTAKIWKNTLLTIHPHVSRSPLLREKQLLPFDYTESIAAANFPIRAATVQVKFICTIIWYFKN